MTDCKSALSTYIRMKKAYPNKNKHTIQWNSHISMRL